MDERTLRESIEQVGRGHLTRRRFVRRMLGLGLTAPMAAQMLASSGATAQPRDPAFTPTRRGGGGTCGS